MGLPCTRSSSASSNAIERGSGALCSSMSISGLLISHQLEPGLQKIAAGALYFMALLRNTIRAPRRRTQKMPIRTSQYHHTSSGFTLVLLRTLWQWRLARSEPQSRLNSFARPILTAKVNGMTYCNQRSHTGMRSGAIKNPALLL